MYLFCAVAVFSYTSVAQFTRVLIGYNIFVWLAGVLFSGDQNHTIAEHSSKELQLHGRDHKLIRGSYSFTWCLKHC